jgi:CubicO group peptidase (beta-lactamase class C family)
VNALRSLMKEAAGVVFPGAVLRVAVGGEEIFHEATGRVGSWAGSAPVTRETRFDVASLTKPMAVVTLVLQGIEEGWLHLDEPVGGRLGDLRGPLADVTLRLLLEHRTGLPDWRPYVDWLAERHPDAVPGSPAAIRLVRQWVAGEPLLAPPGRLTRYSDLGYMLLGWWLEEALGQPLDRLFAARIAGPLELLRTGYVRLRGWDARGAMRYGIDIAAAEQCPFRQRLLIGEVHDENAFALGGVAGHAGLFSTARDVGRWADAMLASIEGRGPWSQPSLRALVYPERRRTDTTWRLGFDTPSPVGSSAGDEVSASAFGHLGFTGCSVWIDPVRRATVTMVTNRVHPSRTNERIRLFRPIVHSEVWKAVDALHGQKAPETTP